MQKVTLADRLGNLYTKWLGFSWLHFFFGPFYCFAKLKIGLGILELLGIYYFLPIPGMEAIADWFSSLSFVSLNAGEIISSILLVFRETYVICFGALFVLLVHLYNSFYINSMVLKKYIRKKKVLPPDEKNARLLIKWKVVSERVELAESFDLRTSSTYKSAEENWYINNQEHLDKSSRPSYESRTQISNTSEQKIKVQVEQLQNTYRLGLISKAEYEEKFNKLMGE